MRYELTMPEHFCEAKTWSQARSGSWSGSHRQSGCQRAAVFQFEDEHGHKHWTCRYHWRKPPANGWN